MSPSRSGSLQDMCARRLTRRGRRTASGDGRSPVQPRNRSTRSTATTTAANSDAGRDLTGRQPRIVHRKRLIVSGPGHARRGSMAAGPPRPAKAPLDNGRRKRTNPLTTSSNLWLAATVNIVPYCHANRLLVGPTAQYKTRASGE